MNVVMLLTNILIIMFEIYLYFDFGSEFFKIRLISKDVKIIVLLIWIIMIYTTVKFDSLYMNLLIIPCIYFGISFIIFVSDLADRCWYTLLFFLIVSGVEGCAYVTLDIILNQSNFKITCSRNDILGYILIIKMVTLIIVKFIKHQIGFNKTKIGKKMIIYIWPLIVSTLLMYGGIFYLKLNASILAESRGALMLGSIGILFSNVLMFYIIRRLQEAMNRANSLELEQIKENLNKIYYEKLNEKNRAHSQIIHNLNYYFETIGRLAHDGRFEEILSILESIDIKIQDTHIYSYCSNIILNAILTEKSLQAKLLNIKFNIFVEPSLNVDLIKDADLISIFGNLINNAIEATQKCENKCINMQLYMTNKNKFIIFKLENTYTDSPKKRGMIFQTIKMNKDKHGIGLAHVRKTLEAYGGYLNIDIQDNLFNVTAMFSA